MTGGRDWFEVDEPCFDDFGPSSLVPVEAVIYTRDRDTGWLRVREVRRDSDGLLRLG